MSLNFDNDFEKWLDEKLQGIKQFGREAAKPLFDMVSKDEEVVIKEDALFMEIDAELGDEIDSTAMASKPDKRLPLVDSTQKGDYYQFVWNEGDEPTKTSGRSSARERVARILRETEMGFTSSNPNQHSTTFIQDELGMQGRAGFRGTSSVPMVPTEVRQSGFKIRSSDGNRYMQLDGQPSATKDHLYDTWEFDEANDASDILRRSLGDGESDPNLIANDDKTAPACLNNDSHQTHLTPPDMQMRYRKPGSNDGDLERSEYANDDESVENEESPRSITTALAESPHVRSPSSQRVESYLPMDSLAELTMDSGDDEAILDLTADMDIDATDTQPIVDQAKLSEQWLLERRRKQMIVVMAISAVVAISACATITYLVVHYLTE